MLNGHKEIVDNRIATLVTSATTINEYMDFLKVVQGQAFDKRNFNEVYTSQALQHMVEDLYRGFKKPIHVFYHNDADQRDAFITEWKINVLENGVQSRDKQADMIFEDKYQRENAEKQARNAAEAAAEAAGVEYTGEREKTIGEMFGLEENDPWDRRTEEELEYDREMKKMMNDAKAAGTMSDDSFASPASSNANPDKMQPGTTPAPNGKLTITDTDGIINADGSLNISNIQAVKTGGPVDENLKASREQAYEDKKQELLQGRKTFSPDDFAAVLAGDGSSDANMIKGDREIRNGTKPIERPSLSQNAEEARAEVQKMEDDAMAQTRRENDFKHKQEAEQGIFRGADLFGEDDVDFDDLDPALQASLQNNGVNNDTVSVKDYPFNSQLGGKSIIPFDTFGRVSDPGKEMTAIVDTVNLTQHGTVNMGATAAMVVSREDESKDGWIIYQRTGGRLGNTVVTSVVRIR